jgi:hypothetical protein
MSFDDNLMNLVKQFTNQTRALTKLLVEEREYFKRNDLVGIEESNIKKSQANEHLRNSIIKIRNSLPQSYIDGSNLNDRLNQYAMTLAVKDKNKLLSLLSAMQDEISNYNQEMTVNRHVINANLAYLKDIFLTLINHKTTEEPQPTYDSSGLLEMV